MEEERTGMSLSSTVPESDNGELIMVVQATTLPIGWAPTNRAEFMFPEQPIHQTAFFLMVIRVHSEECRMVLSQYLVRPALYNTALIMEEPTTMLLIHVMWI